MLLFFCLSFSFATRATSTQSRSQMVEECCSQLPSDMYSLSLLIYTFIVYCSQYPVRHSINYNNFLNNSNFTINQTSNVHLQIQIKFYVVITFFFSTSLESFSLDSITEQHSSANIGKILKFFHIHKTLALDMMDS